MYGLKFNFLTKYLLLIFIFSFSSHLSAQKVFSVDYSSQADIKVFVVDYSSQADLLVHKKDYSSQATGNDGNWFFVDYTSQADKKILPTSKGTTIGKVIIISDKPSKKQPKMR